MVVFFLKWEWREAAEMNVAFEKEAVVPVMRRTLMREREEVSRQGVGGVRTRGFCSAVVLDDDSLLRPPINGGTSKVPFWLPYLTSPTRRPLVSPTNAGGHSTALKIDGKATSQEIKRDLSKQVAWMKEKVGSVPGLAMIRVGDRKDSELYVHVKQVACEEVGIKSFVTHLPGSASEDDLLAVIQRFNNDSRVHGILVQLPLPNHIHQNTVLSGVDLEKDVDGINPINVGRLAGVESSDPTFVPCTPLGCIELLSRYGISMEKKEAVVIGCSNVVGFPTAVLLQKNKASVTIVEVDTPNPTEATRRADIVVSATGVPQLVRGNWLKPGAVVIDVGTTAIEDPEMESGFRVIGDVCFEEAERVASAITPVPGGVGPMTTAMLLSNTLKAAQRRYGLTSR
ncbi:hypothetical protein R1flu_002552 [Riccia fluitans]|uniref:Methenyltetrahydrofolate cyclohydrolase n=1 Tax=Riccia fluitans TaxID=41844 RepID=A0ABD1Y6F0_9MARC